MKRLLLLTGIFAAALHGAALAQGPIPDPRAPNNFVVTPAPGGGSNALGYDSRKWSYWQTQTDPRGNMYGYDAPATIGHIAGAPIATGITARSRSGRRGVTSIFSTFADTYIVCASRRVCASRGCSSMVEQKPSKLMTRVRFPSPAPLPSICWRRPA